MVCVTERADRLKIEIAYQLLLLLQKRVILVDVHTDTLAASNVRTVSAVTACIVTCVLLRSLDLPSMPLTFSFTIRGEQGDTFQVLSHSTCKSLRFGNSGVYLIETSTDLVSTSDPAEHKGVGFVDKVASEDQKSNLLPVTALM